MVVAWAQFLLELEANATRSVGQEAAEALHFVQDEVSNKPLPHHHCLHCCTLYITGRAASMEKGRDMVQ